MKNIIEWLINTGILAAVATFVIQFLSTHTKNTRVQMVEKWALQELASVGGNKEKAVANLTARINENKYGAKFTPEQIESYINAVDATLKNSNGSLSTLANNTVDTFAPKLAAIAKEAVANNAKKDITNEGKKRTAFAFINEKLAEEGLTKSVTFQEIDEAIEKAYQEAIK